MRKLCYLIFMISLLFCSCKNNDPDLEIELPVNSVFIPASIEINQNDINEQERLEIMNLVNNNHIVNDISQLPNDPIGENKAFYNINYQEYTLLIMYFFKSWKIDTYSNLFYRNTKENTYNWVVRIGATEDNDYDKEVVQLTRFAILIRKLPADANLHFWVSLYNLSQ